MVVNHQTWWFNLKMLVKPSKMKEFAMENWGWTWLKHESCWFHDGQNWGWTIKHGIWEVSSTKFSCNQICRAYGDAFFQPFGSLVFQGLREWIYIYIYIIYNIYNENCLNGHFRNLNWSYLSYSLIWYFRFMKFPLVGPSVFLGFGGYG